MKLFNKKSILNEYLHNALYFLSQKEVDAAYREICWAIAHIGGELTEEEKEYPILMEKSAKSVLYMFDEEDKVYLTVCPNCNCGPINYASKECEFCGQRLKWPAMFLPKHNI